MLIAILSLGSCKKDEDKVAIDMTTKIYKADAKYGSYPVFVMLSFKADGKVDIYNFVDEANKQTLSYEVADKMATETTLRIRGTLNKSLMIDGLTAGTQIEWTASIGRLAYNSAIGGFKAGGYQFN